MLLLKVYAALALVTLLALVITVTKIKVVEAIEGTPDPMVPTFKPLKQKTDTTIMYTGNCTKIKTHSNQDTFKQNYVHRKWFYARRLVFFSFKRQNE